MKPGSTRVAIVGTAAAIADEESESSTSTTSTTPAAVLPCNPTFTTIDSVTYYQCGSQYFVQAYGSGGPIYMPVPPPGETVP